jgi:hypothetical protein
MDNINLSISKPIDSISTTNVSLAGLIPGRGKYDWQAGANSPIKRVVLMEDTHWKSVSIPNEIQVVHSGYDDAYDTSMCVTFNGNLDAIEYIMMQQLRLGMIPREKVLWLTENGYFENGVLNFNERFTGVVGETNEYGAYQYLVANGMRNFGVIPQAMFPFAKTFKENIDKKFITQEMYDLGKEFVKRFPINFEWVNPSDTKEFMQYSPLSCFGHYGNQTTDEPIDPKGGGYHSMLQVEETDDYREIDDSYWQQFKKYKKSALDGFMAFYVDASNTTMFDREKFIRENDNKIIRNKGNGAYGVIYKGTPMHISAERAGLFMIDRDARGLLGKLQEEQLTAAEWDLLQVTIEF